jgi:hypothetical protein
MLTIAYPSPGFKIKTKDEKEFIFDSLRKKWLLLTEEEWVRQNFIQYLIQVKKYPSTLIAQEKEIKLGELKKRFDVLVYNNDHQPWMMIECKAGAVSLDEKVLQQILRYNISVPVEYIIITNGKRSFGWQRVEAGIVDLPELPVYVNKK